MATMAADGVFVDTNVLVYSTMSASPLFGLARQRLSEQQARPAILCISRQILREYVAHLQTALPGSDVRILTSAGGLIGAQHFCGKDSILSGPAGGVVGSSRIADAAGFSRSIGFDMGGTSTDVSRYDGRYDLVYEAEKGGVRLVTPSLVIEVGRFVALRPGRTKSR